MKKKTVSALMQIATKHKWLKIPCLIAVTIYLSIYHLGASIGHNYRRLVCTIMLLAFFGVSSSFSFMSG